MTAGGCHASSGVSDGNIPSASLPANSFSSSTSISSTFQNSATTPSSQQQHMPVSQFTEMPLAPVPSPTHQRPINPTPDVSHTTNPQNEIEESNPTPIPGENCSAMSGLCGTDGNKRSKSVDLHHSPYHNFNTESMTQAPVSGQMKNIGNSSVVNPPTPNSWSSPYSNDNCMQTAMNVGVNDVSSKMKGHQVNRS